MTTRTRLANKTIWALEDIVDEIDRGKASWTRLHRRAKQKQDLVSLASLEELRDALARIERLTLDARQGKYGHGGNDAK